MRRWSGIFFGRPGLSLIAAAGAGLLLAQGPFSPWYGEALRDLPRWGESDAAGFAAQLAANPEDLAARLRLMAYLQRADQERADRSEPENGRRKRAGHVLWLIEHHPESEILHSPAARFSRGELTAEESRRAAELWGRAARTADVRVYWNAASFFTDLDAERHLHYLELTAAADPNHPFALRPLAHLYALTVLEGGPLAGRALAGLEASRNVWVLGNAAYMLQSQYNRSIQMGAPVRRAAELAERYFRRAKEIDPGLERKKILPVLEGAGSPSPR